MVNIAFPGLWFKSGEIKNLCFTTAIKNICKSDCHLGAHGSSMCLGVVFAINSNEF